MIACNIDVIVCDTLRSRLGTHLLYSLARRVPNWEASIANRRVRLGRYCKLQPVQRRSTQYDDAEGSKTLLYTIRKQWQPLVGCPGSCGSVPDMLHTVPGNQAHGMIQIGTSYSNLNDK